MFQIDPFSLIPQSVKDSILDTAVDFLSEQGRKLLGDELSNNIAKLRSDAAFRQSFEKGLKRALERFLQEFEEHDEDITQAIRENPNIFLDKSFQAAIIKMIKRPGGYLEDESETIVASFETIFPGRKNRQRVDRAISYLLRCIVKEVWYLPELQPIYSLQFQKMTAEAARRQVEIQEQQLKSLTSLNATLRQSLMQLTDAIASSKMLPSGKPESDSGDEKKMRVLHNLPNTEYGRFIGRENEFAQVIKILRPYPHSQHSVVTIDGIGGIGKSTLALEVGHYYLRNYHEIPSEERFEAIVWVSAKKTVLTADGIRSRPQVFQTLGDLITSIAITLQREEILRNSIEKQIPLICEELTRKRTLLIIDNLETVDDKSIEVYIQELPAPTKAIITTRYRIDATYPVHLVGMPYQDAQELILLNCHSKQVELDAQQIRRLYKRTGGVPIAIVWSIALMAFDHSIEAVLHRLGDAKGPVSQFCFEGSLRKIENSSAYQVLMALSLFVNDANRKALGYITELSEMDRDEGLVDLERLSLVEKEKDRFRLMPLTKEFVSSTLAGLLEIKEKFIRRRIDYLKSICDYVSSEYYWRRFDSRGFVEESAEIIEAFQWAYQAGTAEDVYHLGYAVMDYLDFVGRWNDYLSVVDQILKLAEAQQKHLHIARCHQAYGWLTLQKGEYQEAKVHIDEALKNYRMAGNRGGEAIALQHLSSVYRKTKDFSRSEEINNQALKIADELDDGDIKALILNSFGKMERDRGNWAAAWEHFYAVKEWFEHRIEQSPRDEMLARTVWGHLGYIAYGLKRYQEAKELFQKSLDYAFGYGTLSGEATIKYRLALTEEALGEYESSLANAKEAMECFDRLGMKPDLDEARSLLNRLQKYNRSSTPYRNGSRGL